MIYYKDITVENVGNYFSFRNIRCKCTAVIQIEKRKEKCVNFLFEVNTDKYNEFRFFNGKGLVNSKNIKKENGKEIVGESILSELMALTYDDYNQIEGFFNKNGFLYPLTPGKKYRFSNKVIVSLIKRIRYVQSLKDILTKKDIDIFELAEISNWLHFSKCTEFKIDKRYIRTCQHTLEKHYNQYDDEIHEYTNMYAKYKSKFEPLDVIMEKQDMGVYYNDSFEEDYIEDTDDDYEDTDINTNNIESNSEESEYLDRIRKIYKTYECIYRIPDSVNPDKGKKYRTFNDYDDVYPYIDLEEEPRIFEFDLYSMFNTYNNTCNLESEQRAVIEYCFYYANGYLLSHYYYGLDKKTKEITIRFARQTLKEEIEYGLSGIKPSYDTVEMHAEWVIDSLISALFYSIFSMNPNYSEFRKCANEKCGQYFNVNISKTNKKFCSIRCSKAKAQRDYRLRKKEEKKMNEQEKQ